MELAGACSRPPERSLDWEDGENAAREDPEIVLAAVKRNGWVLQVAAETCRGDREIVLAAVKFVNATI
eukprot:3978971-Amphidinium_carterae.1